MGSPQNCQALKTAGRKKRITCTSGSNLTNKVLLSVWWNMESLFHFELLNQMVTREDLERLKLVLEKKTPIFSLKTKSVLLSGQRLVACSEVGRV